MKRSLMYNPSNILGEMRKKIMEKEEKKDKAKKKKEVVEIDDTVVEEDKCPDVDEEPMDRKRKRESEAVGVDPFDYGVTLHFPTWPSIIQEPGTYVKEVKNLVLKEDRDCIEWMKMSQIQERIVAHLVEALQATVICNDFRLAKTNREKAAEKKNEKMRVEHGEKLKNLKERIVNLKKKVDGYDELYSSKLSLEASFAALQKEHEALKAKRDGLKKAKEELEAAMADAQIVGALGMQKHLLKEFVKHGGTEWEPETKIMEINEVLAEKGIKVSDDEKEDEKGEDNEMDEDASSPAATEDGGDQADA